MTKTTRERLQILSSDSGNDTHRKGLWATAGPDLGLCQGHTCPGYYIWAKRMQPVTADQLPHAMKTMHLRMSYL